MIMKALSILQPWAWLIVRPDITDPAQRAELLARQRIKPVENRTWRTGFRGRFLIHAGKSYSASRHDQYAATMANMFGIELPPYTQIQTGGIVGSAELVDCVRGYPSKWSSDGQYQFVLKDARPEPYRPYRGQLQFFEVLTEQETA